MSNPIDSLHWFLMYFARLDARRDCCIMELHGWQRKFALSELATFNLAPYLAMLIETSVWWQVALFLVSLVAFYFVVDALERKRYARRYEECMKFHRRYSCLSTFAVVLIRIITTLVVCSSPLVSLAITYWIMGKPLR